MSRIRRKVTLRDGEAYVVLDADTWGYLISVFIQLANQYDEGTEEHAQWMVLADEIQGQYHETMNESGDDEDW